MSAAQLLSLVVFSHDRTQDQIDIQRAIKGLGWAGTAIQRALQDPKSSEGRALNTCGYCAVVLAGPNGDEHVARFEDGNVVCIDESGRGLEVVNRQPDGNAKEAIRWLTRVLHYAVWVKNVLEAKHTSSRPPVKELSLIGELEPGVQSWIGQEAEAYFHKWKSEAHLRAAAKAHESAKLPAA